MQFISISNSTANARQWVTMYAKTINALKPTQNCLYFPDDIFKGPIYNIPS